MRLDNSTIARSVTDDVCRIARQRVRRFVMQHVRRPTRSVWLVEELDHRPLSALQYEIQSLPGLTRLHCHGSQPLRHSQEGQEDRHQNRFRLSQHYEILHISYFSPAVFKILLSAQGGMSIAGFPDTVTVPGLTESLNCLWLPRVLSSTQPSSSNKRSTALTFIASD